MKSFGGDWRGYGSEGQPERDGNVEELQLFSKGSKTTKDEGRED